MSVGTCADEYSGDATDRAAPAAMDFLAGGGDMGALMRSIEWTGTPLGPVDSWPPALRTSVSICLNCAFPILIWWGPQLAMLYNDEYRPMLGSQKHPQALGAPGKHVWSEIWDVIGPMLDQVTEQRRPARARDLLLLMDRFGYTEETYFSFSYSPIIDESGSVAGVFCPVIETTQKVISERRLKVLRELAALDHARGSVQRACVQMMQVLARAAHDVPFAMLYVVDEQRAHTARLCALSGIEAGCEAAPEIIRLSERAEQPWPLAQASRGSVGLLIDDLSRRFSELPTGAWSDPPTAAWLLPIVLPGHTEPLAFLIAAVSPRRTLDSDYETFYTLLADQVQGALATARAMQEERERALALAEIDRAKTTFFSNVSHEFRTPLTLMLGPIDTLLQSASLTPAVRGELDVVQRNALRLHKLVNNLLDFSRIEAGRTQVSYEPLDLAGFTRDVASTFRSVIERAGMSFGVQCDAPVTAYVDREMWEKIVLNLLSNAFKFTLAGRIEVRLLLEAGHAVLQVADTGVGIARAELPRVFERFHRIENTTARTHEGTGIGLALVKELVQLHHGAIDVRSTVGAGTTFTVRVPLGVAHLQPSRIGAPRTLASTASRAEAYVEEALHWLPPEAEASAGVTHARELLTTTLRPGTAGARILVADDNADMRDYVRRLLGVHYEVTAVSDGLVALEHARQLRPDLILSDVMMPGLDGFALLQTIRRQQELSAIPVILLSARAGEEATIEGFDAGADDYLVKPFSARELLARVDAQLNLARVRAESLAAIKTSEDRFRALVTASSDVVFRMNPDCTEMRCLEGREFIADTREPSRTWLQKYIHPDDQTAVVAAIQRAIDAKSVFELEHRVLRIDGTLGWALSRALPIVDDAGNITEWFGMATDITARRELEESLREADRQKDRFLAMLAHELRNPLAPIRSAGELLARVIDGQPHARLAVEIVCRQTAHLVRLVDDLLDVSRITQNRIELQKDWVELACVFRQAVETVEPIVRERQHDLQVRCSDRPLFVYGDFARLVQCVANLLTNAAKYTAPEGAIQLTAREEGECVEIEVTDNGAGIPAMLLPKVFDLFVQAERTLNRSQGGLGIGLSLVRRLVEMHEGSVTAHSEGPGHGATFVVRLPLVQPPAHRGELMLPLARSS